MTYEIVSPTSDQAATLAKLWRPTFEFHHKLDPAYYVPDSEALASYLPEYLAEVIEDSEKQVRAAKNERGEFLGLVIFWQDAEPHFDTNIRDFVLVSELFVAETARGMGVGAALMAATEVFAKSRGMKYMKLMASKFNTTALRLYERLGYVDQQRLMFKEIT